MDTVKSCLLHLAVASRCRRGSGSLRLYHRIAGPASSTFRQEQDVEVEELTVCNAVCRIAMSKFRALAVKTLIEVGLLEACTPGSLGQRSDRNMGT